MTPELDDNARAVLDVMAASGDPHLSTLSVDEARRRVRASLVAKTAPLPLRSVEEVSVPAPCRSLRMRLYRPEDRRLPVALFLQGGGWTVNDLDTHDELCRRLARRWGWLIASLDYRRAPEHNKHPAPLEDAYVAYRWLLDNAESIGGEPERLAVVGESSGGMTVATLTVLLRDLGAPMPVQQVLAYPVTGVFDRSASYAERGTGRVPWGRLGSTARWIVAGRASRPGLPAAAQRATAVLLTGMARGLALTSTSGPPRTGCERTCSRTGGSLPRTDE